MDLAVPNALPTMVCRAADAERHPRGRSATRPRSRRCRASPTSRWSTRCRRARQDLRSVHRRRPRAQGRLERRAPSRASPTRRSSRSCARRSCRWRAQGPGAGQDRRGRLHLHVPQQRRARAVRRDRRRPPRQRRGVGRPEVADRGPGRHRQGGRPAAEQGEGQRDHRRRLVRAQAVRRPRHRGGQDLQGDGQAGPADVAPRRRAPPGTRAPDGDLADPGDLPRPGRCSPSSSGTPASRPTSATDSARCSPRRPPSCRPGSATWASRSRSSR